MKEVIAMDGKERIEYYGYSDYWFTKSLKVIDGLNENSCDDINDIIEFNNIIKHLNDYKINHGFDIQHDKYDYAEIIKKLKKRIGVFCSKLNDQNFVSAYELIDYRYFENFWELIEQYKVFEKISNYTFEQVLSNSSIQISDLLLFEKVVKKFDHSIKDFMMTNDIQATSVIIESFFIDNPKHRYYLPESITNEDYNIILKKYINNQDANLNLIEKIGELPVDKKCFITDEVRAEAQKNYTQRVNEFFKDRKGLRFDYNVGITKKLTESEAFTYETDSEKVNLLISADWIKNNLDFPTLLNNFIHIFRFVDVENRITLISKFSNLGLFERIASENRVKDSYLTSTNFDMINSFAIVKMTSYIEYLLQEHNLRIEEVLQWFYDKYLPDEFRIDNFNVFLPLSGRTYLEMCRTMCIEIESTVKQFSSYVKYGFINHDVIEASSTPIDFANIKSLISKKYIYPNNKVCGQIMRLLFSSQSGLTYLKSKNKNYNSFYELISKENVSTSEFADYRRDSLQDLIDLDIIEINDKGYIECVDKKEILILLDLYKNEFINTSYYNRLGLQKTIESLVDRGWITQESSLFSKQESKYFNYFLNKKVSNGLDLRNKYLHGTHRKVGKDDELHKFNYYRLLLLYTLITIKINDELCLVSEINEQKTFN